MQKQNHPAGLRVIGAFAPPARRPVRRGISCLCKMLKYRNCSGITKRKTRLQRVFLLNSGCKGKVSCALQDSIVREGRTFPARFPARGWKIYTPYFRERLNLQNLRQMLQKKALGILIIKCKGEAVGLLFGHSLGLPLGRGGMDTLSVLSQRFF